MSKTFMKVLYDHQIFSWQKFGGISRYFYELMNHSKGLFDYEVSGVFSDNEYMKALDLFQKFPLQFSFKGKYRIFSTINKIDTTNRLQNRHYDVIHPTYYDPYIITKTKTIPLVIDVHDMIFELFPQYFKNTKNIINNKKRYFISAHKIIANSQKTKEDLLTIYPDISEDKITVIYRGLPFGTIINNAAKENYLLFTGQRGRYKNFDNFIHAIAPLLHKYDLRLVCSGQDFTKQENELLEGLHIKERTIYKFVTDAELIELYARARAFIFPSLYEGFGFPILESFAAGCPAILSNASCFPEIAGDAAVYFDPRSQDDMRRVIESVILDTDLRERMIERAFWRLTDFSWKKTVEQTCKIYQKII
jgi:glycosyltransferase involved in cell wall biosynthesis